MEALRVQDVEFTNEGQDKPTLENLNLSVDKGDFLLVAGPSGSGKSTFCDLFNGIVPHARKGTFRGRVFVDGIDTRTVTVQELSTEVGRVFQDPESQFCTLFVADEVAFGPENLCLDREVIKSRVANALKCVGLEGFEEKPIITLSGGQKQRLAIACALSMEPSILVLDEITSNLDPVGVAEIASTLRTLNERGITTVMVCRVLDDFIDLADRLLVLRRDGSVFCDANPRHVLESSADFLLNELNIWIPYMCEVDLEVRKVCERRQPDAVPLFVEEAFQKYRKMKVRGNLDLGSRTSGQIRGNDIAVAVNEASYKYPEGAHTVVDRVSFSIAEGELTALVGQNGAGKTTIAKLMVGLLKPQSGEISLFGESIVSKKISDIARQVGYVFQYPDYQFLTSSVYDDVAYSLRIQKLPKDEEERIVNGVLESLDLQEVRQVNPFKLSMGLKRRVSVACMLVTKLRVLILDEPTFGQDRNMTLSMVDLIRRMSSARVTVIMITHDMRLVQEIAEKVIVMSRGRVIYHGSVESFFEKPDILDEAQLKPTPLHLLTEKLRSEAKPIPFVRNAKQFASLFVR